MSFSLFAIVYNCVYALNDILLVYKYSHSIIQGKLINICKCTTIHFPATIGFTFPTVDIHFFCMCSVVMNILGNGQPCIHPRFTLLKQLGVHHYESTAVNLMFFLPLLLLLSFTRTMIVNYTLQDNVKKVQIFSLRGVPLCCIITLP